MIEPLNGHRFVSRRTATNPAPEEEYPAHPGAYSCLLCGLWETYSIGQEQAARKMGLCSVGYPDALRLSDLWRRAEFYDSYGMGLDAETGIAIRRGQ